MNANEITFEKLPEAVAFLTKELLSLRELIEKQQTVVPKRQVPIGIDDASRIIGKAKPTVYTLVRKRVLPCYKNGKKLYFYEDELITWINSGKKKTIQELKSEAEIEMNNSYRKWSRIKIPG